MQLLAGESCSFCAKSAKQVRLAGTPDVHTRICNECIELCVAILGERTAPPPQQEGPTVPIFTCSFCGRSHRAVGYLITGPRVFICDDCTRAAAPLFA